MDGFLMKKLRRCVAIISPQEGRPVTSYHQLCCASFVLPQHKKGAGPALTRLATLRHNELVRECVHCEIVLAQPMTSE